MSYGVKRPADKWTWVLEEEEAIKHLKVSLDISFSRLKLTSSTPTMLVST